LVSSAESARRLGGKPYRALAADAADEVQLLSRLRDIEPPDVLIHCLSGHQGRNADAYRVVYIQTLRHLRDILRPSFIVFTSSTSVYPQNDGSLVDETSPVGGTPTGEVLLEAEQIALDAGGAAVRLGGIYGPGRDRFISAARAGEPLPYGEPEGFVNFTHRDDGARALVHVGRHRLHGVFNAVDDHPCRRADLARAIRTGGPLPAAPFPPSTGKRVSNAKLRGAGWAPSYASVLDALSVL
jgi:nucleoside-diphosphate-sugar epimerase